MKKSLRMVHSVLVVLLILQSTYFSILLIQFSDSKTFRLLIGFIGIGFLIVMPVIGLANYREEDRSGPRALVPILVVLLALIMPWVPLFTAGFSRELMTRAMAPVAALSLSAAIGGSAVNMFRIAAKNPDGAGDGMVAARWAVSVLVMLMALNLFFPAMARLVAAMGGQATIVVALAMTDRLWETIFSSIDTIYLWMIDFIIAFVVSVKFYRNFFSRKTG